MCALCLCWCFLSVTRSLHVIDIFVPVVVVVVGRPVELTCLRLTCPYYWQQSQLGVLTSQAAYPPLESSLLYEFARSIVGDIADLVPKSVGGVRKAAGLPAR